jgi:hypothetical protein
LLSAARSRLYPFGPEYREGNEGAGPFSSEDLKELKDFGNKLDQYTPLWYYILKEAEVMENGAYLGPLRGRIVGEVIIGLLQLDRQSYLSADPRWRPSLPQRNGQVTGDFQMLDFLTFAGVAQLR